ncbi:ATP-binding protein [Agitococcus lubricus]|uniref:histidine kinase n=1 Tax=Agitococcus lubricus TaxID=1077255 RepID=A0A2T5J2E6_9GAMM|nr:ATP-binding protein [Agitococcus lubricus]PTQ90695.1 histidine kinase [Agitococcus lubricus]
MPLRLPIPSSIFVRLYGGLLLVMSLVAFCTYLLLQVVNDYRAAEYRENMATGFFRLIAIGIERQPEGSLRQAWLEEASALMDTKITLVNAQLAGFDDGELEKLQHGRAVVRLNLQKNYADIFSQVSSTRDVYVQTRMSKVSEQQAKAMAIFLLDDLEHYRGREHERLRELQTYFPFPIELIPLDKSGLEPDQRARIKRNEVVLALKEGGVAHNSSIRIIAPTGMIGTVLIMGPMYLFDWMPVQLLIIISLMSLLVITTAAYFLIHPLEKKIKAVEGAARRIGGGDLSARAAVHGYDEVSQLAYAFNSMAEHIQRLIDSQRELTRAVSHELRTPVARIRFGMEMLADTDDADDRYKQLTHLDNDIDELNKLIDEILTYAKLEQGIPVLNFETIDLGGLLQQVAKETEALGVKATITTHLPPEGTVAEAEHRYLHRVLQNLAGNATRYAKTEIALSAGVYDNYAYIAVEDDGDGIPEKDRERVFQPFTRLDDSRTRASGGYGLGLSIVSRIAFWFGGNIKVEESPRLGGAKFVMTWPIKQKHRTTRSFVNHKT